jgi:predicted RND superfamily exporter protein
MLKDGIVAFFFVVMLVLIMLAVLYMPKDEWWEQLIYWLAVLAGVLITFGALLQCMKHTIKTFRSPVQKDTSL